MSVRSGPRSSSEMAKRFGHVELLAQFGAPAVCSVATRVQPRKCGERRLETSASTSSGCAKNSREA